MPLLISVLSSKDMAHARLGTHGFSNPFPLFVSWRKVDFPYCISCRCHSATYRKEIRQQGNISLDISHWFFELIPLGQHCWRASDDTAAMLDDETRYKSVS